jgi:hypothetical protein
MVHFVAAATAVQVSMAINASYEPASLVDFDLSRFWINASRPDLKNKNLPVRVTHSWRCRSFLC